MKLKECIEYLFATSLGNLYIADEPIEELAEKDLRKIIAILNSTLTDLHTRFHLRESSVWIQSIEWKSNYEISSEYSLLTGTKEPKYILDTPEYPYRDDLLKIIGVTNEVGDMLPLNDEQQWASVFTPRYNVVQLTHPGYDQAFEVMYQANHPLLVIMDTFDETMDQKVEVPRIVLELLAYKVGAEFMGTMGGQEETSKAQVLLGKYEAGCMKMENENLLGTSFTQTDIKFYSRGFV